MTASLRPALEAGLASLGLSTAGLADRLLAYLALLDKWNRAFNLSAIRDPQEMVTRHLLDSLAILPWLPEGRLLDVGTGAGLPGLPLALAWPELEVVLLDSNGKKTRFLRQVRQELGIANVEVVDARVEAYVPPTPFDAITSRAFASLSQFVTLTRSLQAPGGRWLAMKGRLDENELAETSGIGVKLQVHRLTVPGLDADRHLIEMSLD